MSTTLLLLSGLAMAAGSAPDFECADRDGAAFRIWLQPNRKALEIVEKKTTREIPLSEPNVGRSAPVPGKSLLYNRWNRAGAALANRIDLSTELELRYEVRAGNSSVRIALVLDDREPPGLSCRSLRASVPVLPMSGEETPGARFARHFQESALIRTRFGTLGIVGVYGIEAAMRRMYLSPDKANPAAVAQFVSAISAPLKNLDPRTVKLVGEELPKEIAAWWNEILGESRYTYYPELMRFASWINEGTRQQPEHDFDSIQAGFTGFVKSSSYADKGLREFFAEQIDGSLKQLSESELHTAGEELESPGRAFLDAIWRKAQGRRIVTAADAPDVEKLVKRLTVTIQAKEFNPSDVAVAVTDAQHATAGDPEVMALFMQSARPVARKLTPRQREDVMGWLKTGEKSFFADLLR